MSDPLRCREYGNSSRPPVLVLHGGPGAPGSVAALARVIGEHAFAIEPLQRRAADAETRPLTVDTHVADLARVAPPRAAVVGWSWGAMLGLSYAAVHPERVSAVALVGCGTYSTGARAEYRRLSAERLGADGRARMALLRDRLAEASGTAARDAILGEMGDLATSAQSHEIDPRVEQPGDHLDIDADGHQETWADVLQLQADGIEPARFSSISCPVTMLHGDVDPHPGAMIRDTLRAHIPHLEYVEFERCGHSPWLERAARAQFLATLTARLPE